LVFIITILLAALIFQYFYTLDYVESDLFKDRLKNLRIRLLIWPIISIFSLVTIPLQEVYTISIYVGWGSIILYFLSPSIIVLNIKKKKYAPNANY
jgi:ABC-type uncharacterized transport system fused permease/ATPase subunit